MSYLVIAGPPETAPDLPKRGNCMRQRPPHISTDPSGPSLADLEQALLTTEQISAVRRRDLRSAVARVAALLGEDPARLRLDLESVARPAERSQSAGGRPLSQEARQHPLGFFSGCAAEWPSPSDPPAKSELSSHWQTMMARCPPSATGLASRDSLAMPAPRGWTQQNRRCRTGAVH